MRCVSVRLWRGDDHGTGLEFCANRTRPNFIQSVSNLIGFKRRATIELIGISAAVPFICFVCMVHVYYIQAIWPKCLFFNSIGTHVEN